MKNQIPNLITGARGAAGPVIAYLLLAYDAHFLAFWVFLLAIATDMFDGLVARVLDATSDLGRFLDPFADKLLTDPVWLALAWMERCPWWLAGAIVVRDAVVAVLWLSKARTGPPAEPSPTGQIMVAFEGVALCLLVFHGPWLDVHWPTVGTLLGCIALVLSAWSAIGYGLAQPEDS